MLKGLVYKKYYYVSLVMSLVSVVIVIILKSYLPPVVPLLYGSPAGEGQLVNSLALLISPGVGLLVIICNILLSLFVIKDDFLKKILAVSTVLVSVLTTITVVKIVFLVGYF